MSGLKSIVVGIDFSDCSRAALQHALRIAGWSGVNVHAVHVVDVPADVLIVRDDSPAPFRTVVAGVDFSSTSRRALEAAALVARGEGARLYAVHVVTSPDGSSASSRGPRCSPTAAIARDCSNSARS